MKPVRLIVENFLSIKEANLYLKDKGLVSIEGENLDATGADSNGAGKSSVINAILWCLYGSYGKDEAADDVVNSITGKNCMVQFMVEDNTPYHECYYRITRYRKHSKYKNSITVEQLIKPMMQGDACHGWKDITKAGKGIQQQINEIMGADELVFRAACFYQQENPLDIPAMTDKELKALLEKVLPFDNLEQYYLKATEKVQKQKSHLNSLQESLTERRHRITYCLDEINRTKIFLAAYDVEFKMRNKSNMELIEEKKLALKVAESKKEDAALQKEIEQLDFLISEIGDKADAPMALFRLNEAKGKLGRLEDELANPQNLCKTCGQEVEDLEELKARLKVRINDAEKQVTLLNKKYEEAKHHRSFKNKYITEKADLEKELAECRHYAASIARLKVDIEALERSLGVKAPNPHAEALKALESDLQGYQDKASEYEKLVEQAKADLEILQATQQTFSPKGVRYHMLESVAPRLTADTNKYLNLLSDGSIQAIWSTVSRTSAGDFREKFSIKAVMNGREKFGLLSGGEKRKVRLACFFALQDLIASRATKNIELWCGDEIDNALDGAGLERLMMVLNEITKKKSTILVISHNELREWIPNYAMVTRQDGFSTIDGYLNGKKEND